VISHRPAQPEDRTFVIDSWISSYRTSYAAGLIDMEHYHSVMWAQAERYIDRPDVRTIVAVEKRDPRFIYGFVCADTTPQLELTERGPPRIWPALVYYVFVKAAYRRTGVARGLFGAVGVEPGGRFLYACKTPIVSTLGARIPQAKFNPLPARFGKEQDRRSA
jgi:GNAT superfamily N-acetyltransferase